MTDSPIWAITSYFNPASYARRRDNYRLFRERLNIPLIAIEHAFDGPFALGPKDAEVLVQCRGGDVMWQKERLLNAALRALPAACRYVVYIDCDVFFAQDDWSRRLPDALERTPVVQPFRMTHHLPFGISSPTTEQAFFHQYSLAARVADGSPARECIGWAINLREQPVAPGGAIAFRRELLEPHGAYDACIIGGGDLATIAAAYGCFDVVPEMLAMSPAHRAHYLAWAEPFSRATAGAVGCLSDVDLYHLWHGKPVNRMYNSRHLTLR
ncbi:MAG: hypothetical protein QOE14_194, partial [Humisphaera sp.]|nr:hypothetical protein [Humisphaera sp.]